MLQKFIPYPSILNWNLDHVIKTTETSKSLATKYYPKRDKFLKEQMRLQVVSFGKKQMIQFFLKKVKSMIYEKRGAKITKVHMQ